MTESPFGKSNPMDIQDDVIKSVIFTGTPLQEFLETQTVLPVKRTVIVTMAF